MGRIRDEKISDYLLPTFEHYPDYDYPDYDTLTPETTLANDLFTPRPNSNAKCSAITNRAAVLEWDFDLNDIVENHPESWRDETDTLFDKMILRRSREIMLFRSR